MIEYKPKALKNLNKLSKQTVQRIRNSILGLNQNPMRGNIKALQGELKGLYRLRVGDYRVIFEVEDGTISILYVLNRKEAYKIENRL